MKGPFSYLHLTGCFSLFNWLDSHLRYIEWVILLFCSWIVPGTGGICIKLLLNQTEISWI